MTLRVTPWGKDNFKATSGEAEAKQGLRMNLFVN